MSLMKNGSIRCDWCGKLTRSDRGEYLKPDGVSAGYIVQPEWERFPGGDMKADSIRSTNDICEECADSLCPFCGSSQIVKPTPAIAGPVGWGGRCKACHKSWSIQIERMPDVQEANWLEGVRCTGAQGRQSPKGES